MVRNLHKYFIKLPKTISQHNLLGTTVLVSQLNLVGTRTIVVFVVISPAIVYFKAELVSYILEVHKDCQVFSNFDRVLQWSGLKIIL